MFPKNHSSDTSEARLGSRGATVAFQRERTAVFAQLLGSRDGHPIDRGWLRNPAPVGGRNPILIINHINPMKFIVF